MVLFLVLDKGVVDSIGIRVCLFIYIKFQKCGDLFYQGGKTSIWVESWVFLRVQGASLYEGRKGGSFIY